MKRAMVIMTACAAMLAATPSFAQLRPQTQTGSLIPVLPTALDAQRAGIVRKNFARCVYHEAPAKADAFLMQTDIVGIDSIAANNKDIQRALGMDSCLGNEVSNTENELGMKFSLVVLRDLLAEEAYLARRKTAPALPSPAPRLDVKFVSAGPVLVTAQGLSEFVDCTITGDLANADALVRTMPGSSREHEVAAVLAPTLGKCLVQGQQAKLNPRSIRAMVAYGLWTRFVRDSRP